MPSDAVSSYADNLVFFSENDEKVLRRDRDSLAVQMHVHVSMEDMTLRPLMMKNVA